MQRKAMDTDTNEDADEICSCATCGPKITKRKQATIIAALRHWQRNPDRVFTLEASIATDDGEYSPLSFFEIDKLCDELNNLSSWRNG